MSNVINVLVPIVLLVALGWFLRGRLLDETFFGDLNRLVYWVALPVMLFHDMTRVTADLGDALRMAVVMAAATGGCIVLSYLIGSAMRIDRRALGAFVQGGYRGNIAYVGLPVLFFAMQQDATVPAGFIGIPVLVLAPIVPIYNLLAVPILAHSGGRHTGFRPVFYSIATNPLIIACVGGLFFLVMAWRLPQTITNSMEIIGRMALPMALLCIGASLRLERLRGRLRNTVVASSVKLLAAPALGLLIGRHMGLSGWELRIVLVFLACPTAVVSYVMAQQLGSDDHLAGSIIVMTTILSAPVVVVALLFG